MGARGPAPQPTAKLIAEGRTVRNRDAEPVLPSCKPELPMWLDGTPGAEYWNDLASIAYDMKVMTDADVAALALCCQTMARYKEAADKIRKGGSVIKTATGNQRLSPWYTIMSNERSAVLQILAKFGMTPSDRARVRALAEPDAGKSPLAAIMDMLKE